MLQPQCDYHWIFDEKQLNGIICLCKVTTFRTFAGGRNTSASFNPYYFREHVSTEFLCWYVLFAVTIRRSVGMETVKENDSPGAPQIGCRLENAQSSRTNNRKLCVFISEHKAKNKYLILQNRKIEKLHKNLEKLFSKEKHGGLFL